MGGRISNCCIVEAVAICCYFEELDPQPPPIGTEAKNKALIELHDRHMELDGFGWEVEALLNTTLMFALKG